ncbi:MAG: redoxin domain-containing protein [Bdellovibrionales bacterium]
MVNLILIWFSLALSALAGAPFDLKGQDLFSDRSVQVNAAMARPAVVVFVSARCPCSGSHESTLKQLAAEFQDFDFIAVHANADETPEEVKNHFKNVAFAFPLIEDVDGQWAQKLQALKTPHAFVVDRRGQLVFSGGVTDSSQASTADVPYLKNALNEYRASGKVKQARQRALGCAIKRRTKS